MKKIKGREDDGKKEGEEGKKEESEQGDKDEDNGYEDKKEDEDKASREEEKVEEEEDTDTGKNEEAKKTKELPKPFGESSSDNPLKGLLSKQLRFQLVVSSQLLQFPMQQDNVDLHKIYPIHKLQLGDVCHASTRKEIIKTHQRSGELMDEAIKTLQEVTPRTNVDTSLSTMENFKLLIDSFKEYASGLKGQVEIEFEMRLKKKSYQRFQIGVHLHITGLKST